MSYFDVILAGFGGQGILMIGDVLAQAAWMKDFMSLGCLHMVLK